MTESELEGRLRAAYSAAAADMPISTETDKADAAADLIELGAAPRRRHRGRVLLPALAAVIVLVVAGGILVWRHRDHSAVHGQDYDSLVVRDGMRVSATGIVLALNGRPVRMCTGIAIDVSGPPMQCRFGVDVIGLDLNAISDRTDESGVIEGLADVTGVYRAGTLRVTAQRATHYSPFAVEPNHDSPPCPAPSGGWPHNGGRDLNADVLSRYQDENPGQIQDIALSRPSDDQVVALVLTVGDPDPVERALRPVFKQPLCVARSRYSPDQITAAEKEFAIDTPLLNAAGGFSGGGHSIGEDGQAYIEEQVTLVTPALAAAARAQPVGLIKLTPLLVPEQ